MSINSQKSNDSFNSIATLNVDKKYYKYFSLNLAEKNGLDGISCLPKSLKIILENLLRNEDNKTVKVEQINGLKEWLKNKKLNTEISYSPVRVMLQDFTGVPAVADLAAMRDAMEKKTGNPEIINPITNVDLVIDHSVMVDSYAKKNSLRENVKKEFERNKERYSFLKWGQQAFKNFRVVPPGTGICHQVNLEYLSKVVWKSKVGKNDFIFPDTLVGTDSHTTMVNGLSVLGWGVGGIEAEAVMLGQPISMLIPEVFGVEISGKLSEGTTATDLVLAIVEILRKHGVVGKFVEFYGDGLKNLSLADRATIANMAPEYGATCGFFPVDNETLKYLKLSGRNGHEIKIVEKYSKEQGLWNDNKSKFTDRISLNLESILPCISGPTRPQDRIILKKAGQEFKKIFKKTTGRNKITKFKVEGEDYEIQDGSIVIAAITSCTNTSNPNVLVAAGLLAKKAIELNLNVKPWVKTSLAPGSQVVTDYLKKSGLDKFLDKLGFNLVGYGCTTCIGNSGPLKNSIVSTIRKKNLYVASVLSGNRNFEGRINPEVKANYLASPPLVVAYAIAGTMAIDIFKDPLGTTTDNKKIYLKDIWPTSQNISEIILKSINPEIFQKRYSNVFKGTEEWQSIKTKTDKTYNWENDSTYIKKPPFFENMPNKPTGFSNFINARPLLILSDSITTDHISPAGSIQKNSPAGDYFMERQIQQKDFNSYGSRRGNHEIMTRGAFSNIRIKNEMVPNTEGGFTKLQPEGKIMSVYEAAMIYAERRINLVLIAGKEYGTGSSRDWAAKGTKILGIKAVIAESFERIHRSNLVGMGILPLEFQSNLNRKKLKLDGTEIFNITGIEKKILPKQKVTCEIIYKNGKKVTISLLCRIDTENEITYYNHGGILNFVLRKISDSKNIYAN